MENKNTWKRGSPKFKDLLRACPHHGFSELHQLDTFYNALNSKDQDSLNSAAGGNFLDKISRECLAIIKSKSKVRYSHNKPVVAKVSMNTSTSGISPDVAELKDMVKALLIDKKSQNQAPATVKAVEKSSCQAPAYQALAPQTQGVSKEDFSAYVKAMQTQGQNMQNQLTNLTEFLTKFVNTNNASTSSSSTLPSNTIANPRSDLKAITTQSGVSYNGPQIPPFFLPKVVENKPEATKDTVHPTNNGSTKDVQPLVVQSESLILTSEPVNSPIIEPISAPRRNQRPSIPYLSRMQDQKLRDKANDQREKFFQIFKDLNFSISFTDALILMPKFGPSIKSFLTNKDKLYELGRTALNEHCSAVLLKKLPDKLEDPGKFLIRCDFPGKAECLALADLGEHESNDIVRTFHFPVDYVVVDFDADPRVPLILKRSFLKTGRALIDVFEGEITLRVGKEAITFNLDQTSRYPANYNDMTAKPIDVIDMACEEYSQEKLPEKLGDPSKFLIPYDFPRMAECLALADLGASINLMPLSVWNKLSLPDPSPTFITLELADRSLFRPVGVAEDVFVKTGKALIDVFEGPTIPTTSSSLPPVVERETEVTKDMVHPTNNGSTKDVPPLVVQTESPIQNSEPIITPIIKPDVAPKFTYPYDTFAYHHILFGLCNAPGNYMPEVRKELKSCEAKSDRSSIDEPPEVELKDLPPHLEYAFLEGDDKFPVIIPKYLKVEEKTALITVLKSHKRAIAWKLFDIKGIDPEFCTHKIIMEVDFEPAVQHQRRVNPKIHDVIKQKVLKLLDARLIIPSLIVLGLDQYNVYQKGWFYSCRK
nr:reverse transcriptase domain-containing protein [Tanacetum cinerariifolium]